MKKLSMAYIVCLIVFCLTCLTGREFGFGFFIGCFSAFLSFYFMKKAVTKSIDRRKLIPGFMLFLGLRVFISMIIISAGIVLRANPLGIFSGITFMLVFEVVVNYFKKDRGFAGSV